MNYQNKDSACVDSVLQVRFQTLLGTTLWPCMSGVSKATHSVVFSVKRLAFCCEFLSVQDHQEPDTKLSLMRGQYHGDRSWFWGQPVLGLHLGCAICQLYSFGQVTDCSGLNGHIWRWNSSDLIKLFQGHFQRYDRIISWIPRPQRIQNQCSHLMTLMSVRSASLNTPQRREPIALYWFDWLLANRLNWIGNLLIHKTTLALLQKPELSCGW